MNKFEIYDVVEVRFTRACPVRGTVVALRDDEIKVKSAGDPYGEWFAEGIAHLIERPANPGPVDLYGNAL
jgi:hypothetical protein